MGLGSGLGLNFLDPDPDPNPLDPDLLKTHWISFDWTQTL